MTCVCSLGWAKAPGKTERFEQIKLGENPVLPRMRVKT